jgi:Cu(I)/Ag(I) efflux system membrane fusion protein/cobalt-zinc-cadmium efflux system membrane fusion protein
MKTYFKIVSASAAVLFFGIAMTLFVSSCRRAAPADSGPGMEKAAVRYHCPMHPTVISDKPGDCPICGMRLVPMEKESPAPAAQHEGAKKTMYRSTMNPGEVSDKPGKDSMGMDMVPFDVEPGTQNAPKGLAAVTVGAETRQRMGLTLGTVEKRAIQRELRTSALIEPAEPRLYRVTTKIGGWVDRLFVDITGQTVNKGDPLLTIYSPDLLSAQQEYLTALDFARSLPEGSSNLVAAARRRLQLWDISDEQIDRLEKTGKAEKTLALTAPASGVVLEKHIIAGQKIESGEPLMVIADLSVVWGDADIYESDLSFVHAGMPVEISLPFQSEKTYAGTVSFVSPSLDPETRTMKARLEIANTGFALKPGMYADARLLDNLGERPAIPESAVMRTGEKTYAFRDDGTGKLTPVEIVVGARSDGFYEILSGLNEGDRVVTSANFLVDSESSMQAALKAVAGE